MKLIFQMCVLEGFYKSYDWRACLVPKNKLISLHPHMPERRRALQLIKYYLIDCFNLRLSLCVQQKFDDFFLFIYSGQKTPKLGNVLTFCTGSSTEPVLGFTIPPTMEFVNAEFATASTCINKLNLPLIGNKEEEDYSESWTWHLPTHSSNWSDILYCARCFLFCNRCLYFVGQTL